MTSDFTHYAGIDPGFSWGDRGDERGGDHREQVWDMPVTDGEKDRQTEGDTSCMAYATCLLVCGVLPDVLCGH
jgi:hypothetical protein